LIDFGKLAAFSGQVLILNRRTLVKVCGITSLEDGLAAAACGVDAVGFNFWAASSRYVERGQAASISTQLPKSVKRVGLFVNEERGFIERVLAAVELDLLQFHGDEKHEACGCFGLPYIKAIKASATDDIEREAAKYEDASAILLDTPAQGAFGGSGESFDWNIVPPLDRPLILAGGLTPGNVADAIEQANPCAVDVASGVEKSKGIKDLALMQQFIAAVKQTNRSEL